jgi:hypothetical protein
MKVTTEGDQGRSMSEMSVTEDLVTLLEPGHG